MKIADIIRQIADVVDAQEEQHEKEQALSQAAKASEIETAVQNAQELQAGQVAQLVQAAQNIKTDNAAEVGGTPEITAIAPDIPTDELTSADNDDMTDKDTMVPPLQQKHELLKKSADVSNHVDTFADEEPKTADSETIDAIKQLAGIKDTSDPEEMPILSISHDFEPVDD